MADGYLNLPGGAGNYLDTPDHADFDVLGDIDIQVEAELPDWTPAANQTAFSKWTTTSNQRGYLLIVMPSGVLRFQWSVAGSVGLTADSTAATGFTDGTRQWIRATMDVDDGSGNRLVKFYTSPSGASPSWTQLGTTVTTAGTTSIANTTALPAFGATQAGTLQVMVGKIHRLKLRNGFDGAGTLKASPDFTANAGGSTYTDPEGHVWTVRGTATLVTASGPQTVTLGLALEDDSVFAPTMRHAATLGLAQEDDSGFAPVAVHALTLGLAQESDTAPAPSTAHALTLGLAEETDSAAAVMLQHLATLGLATETDDAQPPTLARAVALGLAQELDSGLTLSLTRLLELGLAVETDEGFDVTIPGHEPVAVNVRFRHRAEGVRMRTKAEGVRMRLSARGDGIKVRP